MSATALEGRIEAALGAIDKGSLVELALGLTDVESPLGQEENAATFLHDAMAERGLATELQYLAPGRANALGVHQGTGEGRSLMLNAHLETSGSHAHGFQPARLVDDVISGTGIWNMKATLAAYVGALDAVRKAEIELAGDAIVAAVAGSWDECPVESRIGGGLFPAYGTGTRHALARGYVADAGVVGEPTSFKLVPRHFGITLARIDVRTAVSFSIDDLTGGAVGEHPGTIERAAEIIGALRSWIPEYQRRNELDGVPPGVAIAAIEGGWPGIPASPSQTTIFLGVGTPPAAPLAAVRDELRHVVADVCADTPGLSAEVSLDAVNPGPSVPDDGFIARAVSAAHTDVFGAEPETAVVQWYSDAAPLVQFGIPTVNYGPPGRWGPDDQSVRIADLVDLARVYAALIVRVCGERAA